MSPVEAEEEIISNDDSAATVGLMDDDDNRTEYIGDISLNHTSEAALGQNQTKPNKCCKPRYYLGSTSTIFYTTLTKGKGSIKLAFLSHACFIIGSLFYLRLAFLDLSWVQTTTKYNVPSDILEEDDDAVWYNWANTNSNNNVEAQRSAYNTQFEIVSILGALSFVFVGIFDWLRYCDVLNIFMILAGASGVISGCSDTSRSANIWDLISVHLYLMEAYNLFHREHNNGYYEHESGVGRMVCFRISDLCFLIGSMVEVVGSWLTLVGFTRVMILAQMYIVSAFLWLACALIDLDAEIYFLRRGGLLCY